MQSILATKADPCKMHSSVAYWTMTLVENGRLLQVCFESETWRTVLLACIDSFPGAGAFPFRELERFWRNCWLTAVSDNEDVWKIHRWVRWRTVQTWQTCKTQICVGVRRDGS